MAFIDYYMTFENTFILQYSLAVYFTIPREGRIDTARFPILVQVSINIALLHTAIYDEQLAAVITLNSFMRGLIGLHSAGAECN